MRATYFLLLPAASILAVHVHRASAYTYNVNADEGASSADSDSSSIGLNAIETVYSLPDALSKAEPGDTIVLANGTYTDRLESVAAGEEGNPITIMGGKGAVLQSISPSVHIEHSWITLEGFTVDGYYGSSYEAESFVNKCVEVIGNGENETEAVEGFVMKNMAIQNCGGECVRLKNFVVNANITDNTIQHCGLFDFEFGDNTTGKNGEGIYVGTSSKQWTYGEDRCNGNIISRNRIATFANECVEVKEGSSGNVIEDNVCSNQRDVNSGCFCSRGDSNTFRFNNVSECEGAGVRLGGWEIEGHQYGQNNSVYGNNIIHVDNGAISVNISPQQVICDNTCEEGECGLTGDDDSLGSMEDTSSAACPSEAFRQDEDAPTPSPVVSTPSPVQDEEEEEEEDEEEEEEEEESTERNTDDVGDDDGDDAAADDDVDDDADDDDADDAAGDDDDVDDDGDDDDVEEVFSDDDDEDGDGSSAAIAEDEAVDDDNYDDDADEDGDTTDGTDDDLSSGDDLTDGEDDSVDDDASSKKRRLRGSSN